MEPTSIHKQNLLTAAFLSFAILSGLPLQAQTNPKDTTMNRTVVVEQQYNPVIMDSQKVNVLPEVSPFTTTPNQVEYDRSASPMAALPGSAIAAIPGEEKQDRAKQGYLRLGYGNIGILDVEGNYLFDLGQRDKLNLSLGMQGLDGMVYGAQNQDNINANEKWDARYYRTRAGLDYVHQFSTVDLNIGGNFGLSNFNFVPGAYMNSQRFTSGDARLGVKSTDRSLPMHFDLETGLYLFSRSHNLHSPGMDDPFSETSVRTKANLSADVAEGQLIGVNMAMNNLFHSNDLFENYSTILLNPYYEFSEEDFWRLHVGVNVDLAMGFGKKLNVSPDVKAEVTFSDSYVLYAHATGGRILNDFRRLEQLNRYGEIFQQSNNSYEQLNAAIGFKMSPVAGLWFNIYGGYQIVKDDLYDTVGFFLDDMLQQHSIDFKWADTKNAYGGLQVNYSYKNLFSLMAKGQINTWDSDDQFALRFKPQRRFELLANVRPIAPLNISLGYEYAQRHEMKLPGIGDVRESDLSNLNVGATYELFSGLSVYARASNLLNKKSRYYIDSPVPGINFLGGLIFSF